MDGGRRGKRVLKSLREVRQEQKNKANEGEGVRKGRMERKIQRMLLVLWDHASAAREAAWQETLLAVIL